LLLCIVLSLFQCQLVKHIVVERLVFEAGVRSREIDESQLSVCFIKFSKNNCNPLVVRQVGIVHHGEAIEIEPKQFFDAFSLLGGAREVNTELLFFRPDIHDIGGNASRIRKGNRLSGRFIIRQPGRVFGMKGKALVKDAQSLGVGMKIVKIDATFARSAALLKNFNLFSGNLSGNVFQAVQVERLLRLLVIERLNFTLDVLEDRRELQGFVEVVREKLEA